MKRFPSMSTRYEPSPRVTKIGSPPTARKARTGLFTPPGKRLFARANSRCDRWDLMAGGRPTTNAAGMDHPPPRRGARSVRRGAGIAREVIEHRRDVARIDGLSHREPALGALHRELHHVGRVVLRQRLGELLHGVGVGAQLDEAVARLEPGFGFLPRSGVLLRDLAVRRDRLRVTARKVERRGGEERRGRSERRARPAALQLRGGSAGGEPLTPIEKGASDLELRRVGAGLVGRGGDLIAPRLERSANVAESHVEIAEPLARLQRLGSGGIALHQLAVLLRRAARVVEMERAEIARELEGAAPGAVLVLPAFVAEREEQGARLEERGAVMSGKRQVAGLLEPRVRIAPTRTKREHAKKQSQTRPHIDPVPLRMHPPQRSASAAGSLRVGACREPCYVTSPSGGDPSSSSPPDVSCITAAAASASRSSGARVAPTTFSPSWRRSMSRTPWVLRPMTEISATRVRMIIPLLVMIISSSASVACSIATTLPFRSLVLMSMMPFPPRCVRLYSSSAVRLPYPFSVSVRMVDPARASSAPTT